MNGWKTVIGILVSAAGQALGVYGADAQTAAELMGMTNDVLSAGLGFGGLLLALYGRWKAVTPMLQGARRA